MRSLASLLVVFVVLQSLVFKMESIFIMMTYTLEYLVGYDLVKYLTNHNNKNFK